MAVRFIVGRAGSGKTWRCLEDIRTRLRERAGGGHRLVLLVPEQSTFQMERALIESPDIAGYSRCEVLSFQRLAYHIFAATGLDPRRADRAMGSLGRLMIVRRLIRQHRGLLNLLDRVADKPGLMKEVARSIEELMREDVPPTALVQVAEKIADSNPLGAAKLADLTRLYQAYLDQLIDDRLDPGQYLNLATERLEQCDWLRGAEVWVDGFAGFTHQEMALLTQLAHLTRQVSITFLLEPNASAVDAMRLPAESYSLFTRTERTLVRLRREFTAASVSIESPLRLDRTHRFRSPTLRQLESALFHDGPPVDSADLDHVNLAASIGVTEVADRRAEVEAAVAEIQRLTRDSTPPMRYRDIAVIVRDLGAYHDLLAAAMNVHGIPCFIDRRTSIAHHPLIELVRALLVLAAEDCPSEAVRMTLKTGLLPIDGKDGDWLENYLVACGVNGRKAWLESWQRSRMFADKKSSGLSDSQLACLERVNLARKQWLAGIDPFLAHNAEHPVADGRSWATALYDTLTRLGVAARLQEWALDAEADGRTGEAQMHRQVWVEFVQLLDEFVHALGNESMRIREFREAIDSALAEFDIGLAPPTVDQVLIGAIERSRHPEVRAVLLLGFDDKHFPMRRSEDPLLGDAEREALETAGMEIGPPRRRQLLDERMLVYIAVTRASERLWISYPRQELDGTAITASPYLLDLKTTLPTLAVEKLGDPRAERQPQWITRAGSLGEQLACEFRYRTELADEPAATRRGIWNALYEAARTKDEWAMTLQRTLQSLRYENVAVLAPGAINHALESPFAASVSRLEQFAKCPFAHFSEYLLKLKPRVEADLRQVEMGTLCHAVLEQFVRTLTKEKRKLADLENDEIEAGIATAARDVLPNLTEEMMLDSARHAFLFDRSRGHMLRVARWQRDAAQAGQFSPREAEFGFGYDAKAGLWNLTTPKGRTIRLRGRIDRVDLADLGDELLGMVVDYKRTTDRRLSMVEVYHGLTLQLVAYLIAIQQVGTSLTGRPIRPVAGFYLPILDPYQSVSNPTIERSKGICYRGIADASAISALDHDLVPGGSSKFLSARLKKDGEPYANCDLTPRDRMQLVMTHVAQKMGELADGILDGNIAVSPYYLSRRRPCGFCPYKAVCRYEIETQPPRHLDAMKRDEALTRMEGHP